MASWQISKVTSCPAWQLARDELVTLPVSVSFCTLPREQSNVGVAENVTVFIVPGRQSVRNVPALSEQVMPEKKFTPVRCVCPTPELKICCRMELGIFEPVTVPVNVALPLPLRLPLTVVPLSGEPCAILVGA